VGRFDRHYKDAWTRDTNQGIESALRGNGNGDKGLAAEFPDLVDGGPEEDELCQEASLILEASMIRAASNPGSKPLSLGDALKKAARILAHDNVAERARRKVQDEAGRSAGAELPNPAGQVAPSERGWEENAAAAFDQASRQ
jgi:hypothetical protein